MMKRWNVKERKETESPAIDRFLSDIIEVYKKHGLALSHEDSHGAFLVVSLDSVDERWLLEAHDDR